jgi:hypothetical protein
MNFLTNLNNTDQGAEGNYKTQVQQFSDEELLSKERSKRRRKTGDVVGAGLSAAAAMATPAMWAVAGANAKSFLDNSSKHKILMEEISRRGLSPVKGDMSDTLFPVLASAGSMAVGRAMGGAAGQGVANQASNILQSVSSRAFSNGPSGSKKDKKKVLHAAKDNGANIQTKQEAPQQLSLPSVYNCTPGQAPPAQLVYYYHPPTAQYPNGYYSPAPTQPAMPPTPPMSPQNYGPQPTFQAPPMLQSPQSPSGYQQIPPALAYLNSPSPQSNPSLSRTQSMYNPAPPPMYYQPGMQRSGTFL